MCGGGGGEGGGEGAGREAFHIVSLTIVSRRFRIVYKTDDRAVTL